MSLRMPAFARLLLALTLAALSLASTNAYAQASCAAIIQPATNFTGIVNTFYPGTSASASAGTSTIGVGALDGRGSLSAVAAGDLLLIVQMQDASISTSNTAAYGGSGSGQGYTSLNSSGLFEYAVATGPVAAGSIPLAAPLVNTYHTAAANAASGQKTLPGDPRSAGVVGDAHRHADRAAVERRAPAASSRSTSRAT